MNHHCVYDDDNVGQAASFIIYPGFINRHKVIHKLIYAGNWQMRLHAICAIQSVTFTYKYIYCYNRSRHVFGSPYYTCTLQLNLNACVCIDLLRCRGVLPPKRSIARYSCTFIIAHVHIIAHNCTTCVN